MENPAIFEYPPVISYSYIEAMALIEIADVPKLKMMMFQFANGQRLPEGTVHPFRAFKRTSYYRMIFQYRKTRLFPTHGQAIPTSCGSWGSLSNDQIMCSTSTTGGISSGASKGSFYHGRWAPKRCRVFKGLKGAQWDLMLLIMGFNGIYNQLNMMWVRLKMGFSTPKWQWCTRENDD